MDDQNDVSIDSNQPNLVLHHTYFCDTLISYPNFNFERYKNFRDARMIYRFLSLAQAHLIENIAYSTESAYNKFLESFDKNEHTAKAFTIKKHLEGLVNMDRAKSVNDLGEDGSIIVKADELRSLYAKRETIVIIGSGAGRNFIEKTIKFYSDKMEDKTFSERDIPFRINDYYNVNLFLNRYQNVYKEVIERMKGEPF